MKNYLFHILLYLVLTGNNALAQDKTITSSIETTMTTVREDLMYNIVTILDKKDNITRGFLLGLRSDSIIILKNKKTFGIAINDIIHISIDTDHSNWMSFTSGAFLGMYIGNLIFYQAEDQPTAYWSSDDEEGKLAASLFFAFIGGGIGYIVDLGLEKSEESFDLSGEGSQRMKEVERLKKFLLSDESTKQVHVTVQLAQVGTRFSEIEDLSNSSDYYSRRVTSFNLLRKLQVTYSLFYSLDVGGAISWFGEPQTIWFSNCFFCNQQSSYQGTQSYEGIGYYAVASYHPFKSVFSSSISWIIGAGIGLGSVNYDFINVVNSGVFPNASSDSTIVKINESMFSGLIFTEFDLYLFDEFSLGLVIDYVYLPEEMEAIPELGIDKRSLGNFSIGATIGLHF
ncbi:MAG: hypothetical protein IH950_10110 [Bacteroidetes bacterium]|nr:hypothetical protein [Bacteroidota bacterium]